MCWVKLKYLPNDYVFDLCNKERKQRRINWEDDGSHEKGIEDRGREGRNK